MPTQKQIFNLSAIKQLLKNSRRLFKILWQDKKGLVIALSVVFLFASILPFIQSGSQGLLINKLVTIAGSSLIDKNLG